MQSVRPDAPWCPSNIEFIRRINGLDSIDEVKRMIFGHHLPRAGARRRLPRRARRHAGRPAPPPRHHQVQPRADVDARQRRRHRRGVHVHLRHGGPGRLSALRAHLPSLEHLSDHARVRGREALVALFLRPDPFLPRHSGRASRFPRRISSGPMPHRVRAHNLQARRLQEVSRRERRKHRRLQGSPAGGLRGRARPLAGRRSDGRGPGGGLRRTRSGAYSRTRIARRAESRYPAPSGRSPSAREPASPPETCSSSSSR